MSIISAIAIFEAGYIVHDLKSKKAQFYYNDPNNIGNYMKKAFLDKMDIVLYGGSNNRNFRPLKPPPHYICNFQKESEKYKPIIFEDSSVAENFLFDLKDLSDAYETVTVGDYFDTAEKYGIDKPDLVYMDWHKGWNPKEINTTKIKKVPGGYILDLPEPKFL